MSDAENLADTLYRNTGAPISEGAVERALAECGLALRAVGEAESEAGLPGRWYAAKRMHPSQIPEHVYIEEEA